MQNLNLLAKEIHEGNVARGFYEVQPTLKTQLMLVITELSEAVEADRKGRYAHALFVGTEMTTKAFEENIKDTFEDEIADAYIRLLDIAGNRGIEILKWNLSNNPFKSSDFDFIKTNTHKIEGIYDLCSMIFRCLKHPYKSLIEYDFQYMINMIEAYCYTFDIDLNFHVTEKLKYNSTRPYKHGKNY